MASTVHLSIEVPRHILSTFRQEPDEFLAAMRLAAAVKWYEMGQISQAKAAEIAGLSRAAFLAALGRYGVTPFQATAEELIREASDA